MKSIFKKKMNPKREVEKVLCWRKIKAPFKKLIVRLRSLWFDRNFWPPQFISMCYACKCAMYIEKVISSNFFCEMVEEWILFLFLCSSKFWKNIKKNKILGNLRWKWCIVKYIISNYVSLIFVVEESIKLFKMPRHQIVIPHRRHLWSELKPEALLLSSMEVVGQSSKEVKRTKQARGAAVAHSALILEEMPSEKMWCQKSQTGHVLLKTK